MKNLKVLKTEEFEDIAVVEPSAYSNACSCEGDLFLNGFQVDFKIEVVNKDSIKRTFNISYQNEERTNGMMNYGGYDMEKSIIYGNDWDESSDLEMWLHETNEFDFASEIFGFLGGTSEDLAKKVYERLIDELSLD